MTDRHTVDTITSDDLDQLYAERDGLSRMYLTAMGDLGIAINRLDRVRALADRWDNALPVDKPYARTLRAALDGPGPADTGTTPADTCTFHNQPTPTSLHAQYTAAILTIRDHHVEHVTRTLDTVLDRLKPLRDETGTPIGYVVHPVDPDEYQRWRDALNQPKEQ